MSDKEGLIELTKSLVDRGVEIISTGGTANYLSKEGIRVTEIFDITKFPELMDGRLKTLHPKVHGGLLALRDNEEHLGSLRKYGIPTIDLLVVNLYPFEQAILEEKDFSEIVEKIDVPADAKLPTAHGEFRIRVFHDENTGFDHVALTLGEMNGPDPVLVRVHSECLTGDAFSSSRCDCGPQLDAALKTIQSHGWGCLLYLRQEGRGIGLHAKIQAYNLQDQGADTLDANLMLGHPADARDYTIAAEMLNAVGIADVCLLTNNPDKVESLQNLGITVSQRMPLIVGVVAENRAYLQTKANRMGHKIDQNELKID